MNVPLNRFGTTTEISSICKYICSKDGEFINGAIIVADEPIKKVLNYTVMNDYVKTIYDEKKVSFLYPEKLINYLVERFKINKNSKILELGPGRGEFRINSI